jgi:hypothetical protein
VGTHRARDGSQIAGAILASVRKRQRPLCRRAACLCAGAILVLSCASATLPSASLAGEGGGLGSELLEKVQQPEATTATTASTSSTSKEAPTNKSKTVVLVLVAAVVVLLAVGFVIVRDARKAAPAEGPAFADGGSARHNPTRQRKRRARAKAARQQRKRNR